MSATAPDGIAAWRVANARRLALSAGGVVLLLGSFAADLATGPALLPIPDVLRSLAGFGGDPMLDAIVRNLRLPIALMAAVVGAALGLSGAVMQTVLNNALASSYTLGISAAAGFGAALAILVAPAFRCLREDSLIATGSPVDVLAPSILQQAYGVNVSVMAGPDGYPVVIPTRAASKRTCQSSRLRAGSCR